MIRRIKEKDLKTIVGWFRDRKIGPPKVKDLGDMGFIADDRVAGWLLVTQGSVAVIEAFIANPATIPSHRKQSILTLAAFLVDLALSMGYTTIVCASRHEKIGNYAKQLGFKKTDLTFYMLTDSDQEVTKPEYTYVNQEDKDYIKNSA